MTYPASGRPRIRLTSRRVGSRLLAFPVDARGVGPQLFEAVVGSRVRVEHVDQHVPVVLHDPLARLVPLDPHPGVADPAQGVVDLFRQGVDLAAAGAGAQDEVVVQRVEAPHVEDDNVTCFVIASRPGTEGGPFDGKGDAEGGGAGKRRGSQVTSSGPSDVWEAVLQLGRRRGVVVAVEHLPSVCPQGRATGPGQRGPGTYSIITARGAK